jgi:hypothetical protein
VVGEALQVGAVPRGLDGGEDAGLALRADVVVPRHSEAIAVDGVVAGLDFLRRALQVGQIRTVAGLVDDRIGWSRHHLRQLHLLALSRTAEDVLVATNKNVRHVHDQINQIRGNQLLFGSIEQDHGTNSSLGGGYLVNHPPEEGRQERVRGERGEEQNCFLLPAHFGSWQLQVRTTSSIAKQKD